MKHRMPLFTLFCFLLASLPGQAAPPALAITEPCPEAIPLFGAIPANETFVTSTLCRETDGRLIGATCGKKAICLFSFDAETSEVKLLDSFEAPWWDEPRLALAPNGDIYLGARLAYDKPFVFERLRERPHTPDAFLRHGSTRPAGLSDLEADGMPIRHYSQEGLLLDEIPLPSDLAKDGVGALLVCADGAMLCGLSAPGGRAFTISLETGEAKVLGETVRLPEHHHTRRISKCLMPGDDGLVYFYGWLTDTSKEGTMLALDPRTGTLTALDLLLPAVVGRHRFAAVDAAVRLEDGTFLGGTSDGYLFRFDPINRTIEGFGKPLRQQGICGLVQGSDGLIYGAGAEPLGLPRLFAFDPLTRELHLGTSPSAAPPEQGTSTFGEVGALAATSTGALVCAEKERRGFLMVYRPEEQRARWRSELRGEALAACTRDRYVDAAQDGRGFLLAPTFLLSDAMARSSKISESLTDEAFARKIFNLDGPCQEAELLFYGGGGTKTAPMLILVNGHEILHIQDEKRMLTGGWDRETIPGELLRPGRNEIIFGCAGRLLVDTDAPGEHSAKSTTKWGPWRSDTLGNSGDLSGEYVVRLRVHGYPRKGIVTSPIIDLAQADTGEEGATAAHLPPIMNLARLRISMDASTPPQTAIHLALRHGSTPEYVPAHWSTWLPPRALAETSSPGRFVQWRATLTSSRMDRTPLLRAVIIAAAGDASGVNREHIKISTAPDNALATSSYEFHDADPYHPRMRHLREKYHLDKVVAPGQTEAEKFALLRQWVREQWEGWNDNKYDYCPQWDALEILELAPANLGLGMCTHYAAVFTQCAAALGYHARSLIVDHHCLTEVWSDQYGKWILQDPGLIPKHAVAFQYEHDGIPINALEMHQRSLAGDASDISVRPDPPRPTEEMRDQMVRLYCRFAIPLRNDHLYRPEPQELEHGNEQYHWDGYLWWTDSLQPTYPEYSLLTNRPEDFYWTLNKTIITLQDTEEEGTLVVRLSGPIPNLATFMVRFDEGDWRETTPDCTWSLHPGHNTLEARAVNTMGIECPPNKVILEYQP